MLGLLPIILKLMLGLLPIILKLMLGLLPIILKLMLGLLPIIWYVYYSGSVWCGVCGCRRSEDPRLYNVSYGAPGA